MFMGDEYERAGLALLLADEVLRTERTLSVPFGLGGRLRCGGGRAQGAGPGLPWTAVAPGARGRRLSVLWPPARRRTARQPAAACTRQTPDATRQTHMHAPEA